MPVTKCFKKSSFGKEQTFVIFDFSVEKGASITVDWGFQMKLPQNNLKLT